MTNLDFNFFCSDCKMCKKDREENCFTNYIVKEFKPHDYIVKRGDKVRNLALLIKGSIIVSFPHSSGIILRSTHHTAPYPIGAVALFGKENRYRVDVIANEYSEVIFVSKEDIEQKMKTCSEFMHSYFDYSTSKIDLFIEQLALLSQRSITSKLGYYILSCTNNNNCYKFNKSIKELSEYLCVERPSLSRVIAQFVKDDIITYHNREGKILDFNKIKEILE